MILKCLIINKKDNVAVLLENGKEHDAIIVDGQEIELHNNVEFGHKVAIKDFDKKDNIYKYGEEIGYATKEIHKGEWVHVHNMDCRRGK